MSITIENADGNWLDRLLNRWPFLVDTDSISTIAIAWLFKEDGQWRFLPRLCGTQSLFYNAVLFVRLSWPLGLFFSMRWSGSSTGRALLQCGVGWKLNGRIAALFRSQSDATSAEGVSGPNTGQAQGWDFGTH